MRLLTQSCGVTHEIHVQARSTRRRVSVVPSAVHGQRLPDLYLSVATPNDTDSYLRAGARKGRTTMSRTEAIRLKQEVSAAGYSDAEVIDDGWGKWIVTATNAKGELVRFDSPSDLRTAGPARE